MIQFWLCWLGIFVTISICAKINNDLNRNMINLIPWIVKTYIPALRDGYRADEAHVILKQRISVLDVWYKGSLWYGYLTVGLQVLMILVAVLVTVYHWFPYILLMVIVMLLGSMVVFLPRTVNRRTDAIKVREQYFLTYADLKKDEKINGSNIAGSDGGTSTHS